MSVDEFQVGAGPNVRSEVLSVQPATLRSELIGTPYLVSVDLKLLLSQLAARVRTFRGGTPPSPDTLAQISKFFRIKNIYHSNAIEGNQLNVGETRLVVEQGMTITGKSLKDQAEARNLSQAIDFMELLASENRTAITESDIRQVHKLILNGIDNENAGMYRKVSVEISGSQYKTPGPESVPAQMSDFAKWLAEISVPGARFASSDGLLNAVAAHAWFVYIHPFVDGNGRVSRILMNLILMRYGFPIAIIGKDDRKRYYDALEVSQSGDLTDFLGLVHDCECESVDEYESAIQQQRQQEEWTTQLVGKLTAVQQIKSRNDYELWRSAMDLLKNYFEKTILNLDARAAALGVRLFFKSFDTLEFEKYQSLRNGYTTKRTWFFRIDLRGENSSARYLFFFGMPSQALKQRCDVTVHLAREERPYYFERLENITAPNVPNLFEIGYVPDDEIFIARNRGSRVEKNRIEAIGKNFMESVASLHFSN